MAIQTISQPRPHRTSRLGPFRLTHRGTSTAEADAIVAQFDAGSDHLVIGSDALSELRAAAAQRRQAEVRIEAAALRARRSGASWGVIGAQLGMTRQGARQRFERLLTT